MTLYLKYRPKDFDSLEWQSFIKNTLKQAILKDKLVWAYLFCWPRWTWKTSTARIFAKAINCLNPKDWNPCLNCEICAWFETENLVDIIEIDAASYTWVDNVREIIEKAKFSPTKCKYKVYIIDEVHMLSKWAFNALLKILEEPPSHLKFILATTESHKIPETILSRCQRYDFKALSDEDLGNRLKYIAKCEDVNMDDLSLEFILKQSNWWARNAISLFEQLINNNEINFQTVVNNYWVPKTEVISNFYDKILSKDISIINDFDEIAWNYNLNLFFKELLFFIKDNIIKNISNDEILKQNIFLIETLEKAYLNSKNSFDPKTTYLVWIIKSLKWSDFIKEEIPQTIPKQIPKVTQNFTKPVETEIQKPKVQDEEFVTHDDLFDVFWWNEEVFSEIPKQNSPIEPKITQTQSSNSNFNKDAFIDNLKTLKAKWALTMSLRWSDMQISWDKLIIYSKTSISTKQITQTDNIALMSQALVNLWLWDIQIEVKNV